MLLYIRFRNGFACNPEVLANILCKNTLVFIFDKCSKSLMLFDQLTETFFGLVDVQRMFHFKIDMRGVYRPVKVLFSSESVRLLHGRQGYFFFDIGTFAELFLNLVNQVTDGFCFHEVEHSEFYAQLLFDFSQESEHLYGIFKNFVQRCFRLNVLF